VTRIGTKNKCETSPSPAGLTITKTYPSSGSGGSSPRIGGRVAVTINVDQCRPECFSSTLISDTAAGIVRHSQRHVVGRLREAGRAPGPIRDLHVLSGVGRVTHTHTHGSGWLQLRAVHHSRQVTRNMERGYAFLACQTCLSLPRPTGWAAGSTTTQPTAAWRLHTES
jgi:hypothetical protein